MSIEKEIKERIIEEYKKHIIVNNAFYINLGFIQGLFYCNRINLEVFADLLQFNLDNSFKKDDESIKADKKYKEFISKREL